MIHRYFLKSIVIVLATGTFFLGGLFVFAQEETQAAPDEAETAEAVDTRETSSTSAKLKEKTDAIAEAIPEPVKEKTDETLRAIERFRTRQAEGLYNNIVLTKARIDELNRDTAVEEAIEEGDSAPGLQKPVTYIKLVVLEIVHFIFKIKALFYIVGVLLILSILRSTIRRIRRGNSEYD